jgi:hypothetical protein
LKGYFEILKGKKRKSRRREKKKGIKKRVVSAKPKTRLPHVAA